VAVVLAAFINVILAPPSGDGNAPRRFDKLYTHWLQCLLVKPDTARVISVIIPTYNERDNIAPLLERIDKALSGCPYEVIFVDDNSRDGTGDAVRSLAGKYPVKLLVRTGKRGLASAVVDGIALTSAPNIAVMDADLQHPPEVLRDMLAALKDNELVVGSRWVAGGGVTDWSRKRVIISRVANLLALGLAPRIKDRTSGFFGFRKSAVDVSKLSPTGWKIGLEIMARGVYTRAAEVPFTFVPRARGESKLSSRQMVDYLKQLFSLYMSKFPILNFMVVGGIGFVVNLGLYTALLLVPAFKTREANFLVRHIYVAPFIMSSFVAIVCNYTLNRIWTFKGWDEQSLSFVRYLSMASVTLVADTALLSVFVDFGKLNYTLAAALAIIIVFIVRYAIARRWIWRERGRRAG
jgi:dolichol-phosphate mannosyltransferase